MKRLVSYDIEQYAGNTSVFSKRCNGIIFRNGGDVDASINGIPLPAGEFNDDFANNHPGDIITNNFQLAFKPGVSGTNKLVSVIRIFKVIEPTAPNCDLKK